LSPLSEPPRSGLRDLVIPVGQTVEPMEPFFNTIAAWFAALGIHPVFGGFLIGALLTYFLLRRRPRGEEAKLAGVDRDVRPGPGPAGGHTVEYDGRDIDVPAEVMAQIRSGNRIGAIKALRQVAPIELIDAKRIVDALAAGT
jgi:hypothetical protein